MENKSFQETDNYLQHSDDPIVSAGNGFEDEADGYPFFSRLVEAVEENPGASAAAAASALGVLFGATFLGRKAFRRETTLEKAQSTLRDLLDDGAEILKSGKQRGAEMTEQVSSSAEGYRADAQERLDSLGSWFRNSASRFASELPSDVKKASQKGLDAVTRAAKKEPIAAGTVALAAAAAIGTFFYATSGSSNGKNGSHAETREELYEQAKKLGINGRSAMSKQQLRRAIKRHQ